ncbi:MAG: hypothetical protein ABIM99_00730 [Candidatus Dojkabacteria bacterium]
MNQQPSQSFLAVLQLDLEKERKEASKRLLQARSNNPDEVAAAQNQLRSTIHTMQLFKAALLKDPHKIDDDKDTIKAKVLAMYKTISEYGVKSVTQDDLNNVERREEVKIDHIVSTTILQIVGDLSLPIIHMIDDVDEFVNIMLDPVIERMTYVFAILTQDSRFKRLALGMLTGGSNKDVINDGLSETCRDYVRKNLKNQITNLLVKGFNKRKLLADTEERDSHIPNMEMVVEDFNSQLVTITRKFKEGILESGFDIVKLKKEAIVELLDYINSVHELDYQIILDMLVEKTGRQDFLEMNRFQCITALIDIMARRYVES